MLLPVLSKSNQEYIEWFENNWFWRVGSYDQLDDATLMLEVLDRSKYGKTIIFRTDEPWDPHDTPGYRVIRICPGSRWFPPRSGTSEEFALWCLGQERLHGLPVLVTWAAEQQVMFTPDGCWRALVYQGVPVFIRQKHLSLLSLYKQEDISRLELYRQAGAAFNSGARDPWFELPEDIRWYYADSDYTYDCEVSFYRCDPDYSLLVDRFIAQHRRIGNLSSCLVGLIGQCCEPALLNREAGEGYRITMEYGNTLIMTAMHTGKGARILWGEEPQLPEVGRTETIHRIRDWRIPEPGLMVMDVRVVTRSGSLLEDGWYRLDFRDLLRQCESRKAAVHIVEALGTDLTAEMRSTNEHRHFLPQFRNRYWTVKIFSNPWIDRYGNLTFLNGFSLIPFWAARLGTIIDYRQFPQWNSAKSHNGYSTIPTFHDNLI